MTTTSSLQQPDNGAPGFSRYGELALLVALNAVPLFGVLFWDWRSFDLIFLYWLENVVIGVFVLARIVMRAFAGVGAALASIFLGLFFLVHYGMFCYGHGSLVIGLFGPTGMSAEASAGDALFGVNGLLGVTAAMLSRSEVLLALAALVVLQLFEELKTIREHGLAGDSLFQLMTAPYRRIIVLHVALLGSGFLLLALDEPLAGLLLLVVVKTAADCRLWLRAGAGEGAATAAGELTADEFQRLEKEFGEPKLDVNGEVLSFDSFAELRASPEYRRLMSMAKMVGASSRIQMIEAYLEQKIAAEQAAAGPADEKSPLE